MTAGSPLNSCQGPHEVQPQQTGDLEVMDVMLPHEERAIQHQIQEFVLYKKGMTVAVRCACGMLGMK